MKGSIIQRGNNKWLIRVYLGSKPDGKPDQKTWTVTGAKKDAEKDLRKFLTQKDNGTYRAPTKLTVGAYLQDWVDTTAKLTVSALTLKRYIGIIQKDLKPNLGSIELQKLTSADILRYYAWASDHGRKDGKGGLSKKTILQYHRILHNAMERAVEDEIINSNPVKESIAPVPDDNENIHVISYDEARALLDVAGTCKYRDCIQFALQTGMRRGEILGIKFNDCNLDKGELKISRSLCQIDNETFEKSPKTKSGRRTIKLMKSTVELLRRIKSEHSKNKLFLEDLYVDNDYIFAEANGEPYKPESMTHSFIHFRNKVNLKITFHDLRHTHASWLLASNIHPKIVSERLGHSGIQITLDLYSHLLPHIQGDAVLQFEDMLGNVDDIFGDIPDINLEDIPDI